MSRDAETTAPSRRMRLPLVIGLGVAIAAAGWTAVWATARGRILAEIDGRLATLSTRGVVVACADREIGGYPFRMELTCRSPGVEIRDRGFTASAQALRVVAQVWDPRLVLVEVDGPGIAVTGGDATSAKWRLLRSSLRWAGDGVQRVSLSVDGLDLTAAPAGPPPVHLVAEHVEAHGRPHGEGGRNLDLATAFAGASLTVADKRIGPPRADLSVSATLVDFLPPGPGAPLPAFAARGGRIEPTKLSFAVGGIVVEGDGALVLDREGVLDGMITLVARGLETLTNGGAKGLGPELTTVLSGFVLLGKAAKDPDRPGRRLEMIVDHGLVRIGRVTLGRLAPLFAVGS
ncbi:DUF2125 domain-containing protein [Pinisolibacter sp.]|uniref:DUF2125 domain-containing protein n=1 Tax=Pinisolibacter sp. TaxID=2172024 RepID=UPI002FDC7B84